MATTTPVTDPVQKAVAEGLGAPVTSPASLDRQIRRRAERTRIEQTLRENRGKWALSAAFVAAFAYLWLRGHWNAAAFQTVNATNFMPFLTPLLFTAALIERAVEVVISPWRDPEADKKQNKVNNATVALVASCDGAKDDLDDATDELSHYTGQTRRYAFAIALGFSVIAVMAGVRCLWPMLDGGKLAAMPAEQQDYFRWFDMVLTTLLLAGGAAGLHAPINAFTTFFERAANGGK